MSDVSYRLLEPHEVAREGDRADDSLAPMDMWRRIRMQSDGWRRLDEGETLRAGDEEYWFMYSSWRQPTDRPPYAGTSDRWRRRIDAQPIEIRCYVHQVPLNFDGLCDTCDEQAHADRLCAKVDAAYRCTECNAPMDDRRYSICDACDDDDGMRRCAVCGDTVLPDDDNSDYLICGSCIETDRAWQCAECDTPNFLDAKRCNGCGHPRLVACGCGHHTIDPSGDVYAQHRRWLFTGEGGGFYREWAWNVDRDSPEALASHHHIRDLSRPEVEVLCSIDHPDFA